MDEMLPTGQPDVAQRLRDHAARSRARLSGGLYCGAMARKIVSGPMSGRIVAYWPRAELVGESGPQAVTGL